MKTLIVDSEGFSAEGYDGDEAALLIYAFHYGPDYAALLFSGAQSASDTGTGLNIREEDLSPLLDATEQQESASEYAGEFARLQRWFDDHPELAVPPKDAQLVPDVEPGQPFVSCCGKRSVYERADYEDGGCRAWNYDCCPSCCECETLRTGSPAKPACDCEVVKLVEQDGDIGVALSFLTDSDPGDEDDSRHAFSPLYVATLNLDDGREFSVPVDPTKGGVIEGTFEFGGGSFVVGPVKGAN